MATGGGDARRQQTVETVDSDDEYDVPILPPLPTAYPSTDPLGLIGPPLAPAQTDAAADSSGTG